MNHCPNFCPYSDQFFSKMDDFNMDMSLEGDTVLIKKVSGRLKKGSISVEGKVLLSPELECDSFEINVRTSEDYGIYMRFPFLTIPRSMFITNLGVSTPSYGDIKGELRIYGSPIAYNVDGKLEIENSRFTYPPQLRGRAPYRHPHRPLRASC